MSLFQPTTAKIEKWKAEGRTNKIVKALDEGLYNIRVAAIRALGELKDQSAYNTIQKYIDDKLEIVSIEAILSIQNFVLNDEIIDKIVDKLWEWEDEREDLLRRRKIFKEKQENKQSSSIYKTK